MPIGRGTIIRLSSGARVRVNWHRDGMLGVSYVEDGSGLAGSTVIDERTLDPELLEQAGSTANDLSTVPMDDLRARLSELREARRRPPDPPKAKRTKRVAGPKPEPKPVDPETAAMKELAGMTPKEKAAMLKLLMEERS